MHERFGELTIVAAVPLSFGDERDIGIAYERPNARFVVLKEIVVSTTGTDYWDVGAFVRAEPLHSRFYLSLRSVDGKRVYDGARQIVADIDIGPDNSRRSPSTSLAYGSRSHGHFYDHHRMGDHWVSAQDTLNGRTRGTIIVLPLAPTASDTVLVNAVTPPSYSAALPYFYMVTEAGLLYRAEGAVDADVLYLGRETTDGELLQVLFIPPLERRQMGLSETFDMACL
ncbi:hypothetical protein M427DRAFT_32482 [Gonapodya prolifera JEL478]|uniref:Uncharacterized protein n=1 Tax=Gonapodya prolifera (strain JEL478) TaxID=1344416 RepID=A0A139AFS4_GONPJ|nr:hypothetical protein M427DRAFT_32482 [Gonapodya prolifera JEL478]|eukprot:KXS15263.1 hypothetical protein M427DRAFT_32482 [Gonapodya prolifera JEL478]